MSDEEDYDSDEDEDYVPTDGEAVSEEEHSGDEENLDSLREDGEPLVSGKRKKKSPKKKPQDRKRKGGIQLEGETVTEAPQEDKNVELATQIREEQIQRKEEQLKKRSNDLWASFLTDVGTRPDKKPAASTSASPPVAKPVTKPTSASQETTKKTETAPAPTASSAAAGKSTITVTKVFDFAGEAVKVTKELDVNSKEGKAELKKQQEETSTDDSAATKQAASAVGVGSMKRPGGGLGGILDKINKKPKMGTLEKSKLDWESFKEKEGIDEELKIHNRGKESYIERMNFLQRADQRQFEIEKSLRLNSTSKR